MGTHTNRVMDKRTRGISLKLKFQNIKQEIKIIIKIIIMIIKNRTTALWSIMKYWGGGGGGLVLRSQPCP